MVPDIEPERQNNVRPLKNVNFCSSSRKTKNLTGGIYGIFRGLNFEFDAEIGQKGAFFKGRDMHVCISEMVYRYPASIHENDRSKDLLKLSEPCDMVLLVFSLIHSHLNHRPQNSINDDRRPIIRHEPI